MTLKAYFTSVLALFRRRIWLPALWFLVFFFSLPVAGLLLLQERLRLYEERASNMLLTLEEWLYDGLLPFYGQESNLLCALLIGMAVISGLAFSAYLFQNKQVDFYHSQPIRRAQLFARNYLAGALTVILPYLLNLLLFVVVVLIMAPTGVLDGAALGLGLLTHLLYFLAIFGTVLLAAMLCGHLVVAALTTLILLGALPALFGLGYALSKLFYPVIYHDLYSYDLLVRLLSPAAAYILTVNGSALNLLPVLLFDAAVAAAALAVYRVRPSEAAGQAVCFKIARVILKYLVALAAGMCGASLFYTVGSSNFWYYFGAVVGVLLATQVIEIIYHFDFKAVRLHWGQSLLFLLVFLLLSSCGLYDWTNFNSYAPQAARVVSAQVVLPGVNDYVYRRGNFFINSSSYGVNISIDDSTRQRQQAMLAQGPVNDPEAITALCEMGRLFADNTQQDVLAGSKYTVEGFGIPQYYNTTGMKVVYTLNNGRQVARDYSAYNLPVQFLLPYLQVIYGQEEFREAQIAPLYEYAEHCYVLGPTIFEQGVATGENFDSEMSARIMEALLSDLSALTMETQLAEMPIGSITLFLADLADILAEDFNDFSGHFLDTAGIPIYPSFSNTLALLYPDYPSELWGIDPERVIYTSVDSDTFVVPIWHEEGVSYAEPADAEQNSYTVPAGLYEDKARIREVLLESYDSRAYRLNCFRDGHTWQSIEVVYESPIEGNVITRYRHRPLEPTN